MDISSHPECSADHLLGNFKNFYIKTGAIRTKVIESWFDSDCPKLQYLLNWLCTSLTEENHVTALEVDEYKSLQHDYQELDFEKQRKFFESKYPVLFEYKRNLTEVDRWQDEIEWLKMIDEECDSQIRHNKDLGEDLSLEISKLNEKEDYAKACRNDAFNHCLYLSNEVDNINRKTFSQIRRYLCFLGQFNSNSDPQFLNSYDFSSVEDEFVQFSSYINSLIRQGNDGLDNSLVLNTLLELQNRLLHSKVDSTMEKVQANTVKCVNSNLHTFNINTLSIIESSTLSMNIEAKQTQYSCMMKMFESKVLNISKQQAFKPLLEIAQNELNCFQAKSMRIMKVNDCLMSILAHFKVIDRLGSQEKMDIDSSEPFFRSVFKYINEDIRNCTFRTRKMESIIATYQNLESHPIEQSLPLLAQYSKCIKLGENFTLKDLLHKRRLLTKETTRLQNKLFIEEMKDCTLITEDLECTLKNVEIFLRSGPTRRIQIRTKDFIALKEADLSIAEQQRAVKRAMKIFLQAQEKMPKDKWQKHKRRLWAYFLGDPARMLSMIAEAEQKCLKKNQELQSQTIFN